MCFVTEEYLVAVAFPTSAAACEGTFMICPHLNKLMGPRLRVVWGSDTSYQVCTL